MNSAQNMALEQMYFLLNLVDISSDNQRPPGVRKIRQLEFWRQCVLQVFLFQVEMHSSSQGPCLYLT